ncbi:MAG: hypothetical protein Q9170_004480 [Blastenia crenularia]
MAFCQDSPSGNAAPVPIINKRKDKADDKSSTPLSSSPSSPFSQLSQTPLKSSEHANKFNEILLANLNNEAQLFFHLAQLKARDERPWLYSDHGTLFTIRITNEILEHPDRFVNVDDSCYIQIGAAHHLFSSQLPKNPRLAANNTNNNNSPDICLPLGHLVEHWPTAGEYCPTRYACLLNISTLPLSIWLMYDYVTDDGDYELLNTAAVYDDSREGYLSFEMLQRAKTRELLRGKDLVLFYQDIKDWVPGGGRDGGEGFQCWDLGCRMRAWTARPPKDLLDDIMVVREGGRGGNTCRGAEAYLGDEEKSE